MGKVDNKAKRQIVLQRKKGHSVRTITDSLKTKGYSISRHAVRYWLKAYNRGDLTESNEPETPTQRTFKKVSVRDAELIQQLLIDDPSLSSRAVHRELLDDGAKFSLSTTKKSHSRCRVYMFQTALRSPGQRQQQGKTYGVWSATYR